MAYDPRVFTAQETERIRAFQRQQEQAYLTFTAGKSWSADPTTRAREAETIRRFKRDQDAELTRFQSDLIQKRGQSAASRPWPSTASTRQRSTTSRPTTKTRTRTGKSMPPRKQSSASGTTRVRRHTRRDGTRVRSHKRTVNPWRDAGAAWAGAAVSGATTAGLVLELGFTLISTVAILLTVILGGVAVKATSKSTKQRRTLRTRARAAARPRSRPAASRARTTSVRRRR